MFFLDSPEQYPVRSSKQHFIKNNSYTRRMLVCSILGYIFLTQWPNYCPDRTGQIIIKCILL